jgi:hypothetical protein
MAEDGDGKDEPRGYLLVEKVDILSVGVIRIYIESLRYAVTKPRRKG